MNEPVSFKGYSIVSCGTLHGEIEYLKENSFFKDIDKIFYTEPGLHEKQRDLEKQLVRRLENAKKYSEKIIVVYGERCFLDPGDYTRNIDRIIQENGPGITRVKARTCVDMPASPTCRFVSHSLQDVSQHSAFHTFRPALQKESCPPRMHF